MSTDPKRRDTPKRKRVPPENRFVQAKKKRELEQENVSCVNSVTNTVIAASNLKFLLTNQVLKGKN